MRRPDPTVPLYQFMPYGAPELIESSSRHFSRAVALGSGMWLLGFALAVWIASFAAWRPLDPPIVPLPPPPPREPLPPVAGPAPVPLPPTVRPVPPKIGIVPTIREIEPVGPPTMPTFSGTDEPPPQGGILLSPGGTWAPPTEPLPRRVEWIYTDRPPQPIRRVMPDYPALARDAGVAGRVTIAVLVDRDGSVMRAEVESSVPMLDRAALEAGRKWRFEPALADGHPVRVWVRIPFKFSLHEGTGVD